MWLRGIENILEVWLKHSEPRHWGRGGGVLESEVREVMGQHHAVSKTQFRIPSEFPSEYV